MASIVSKITAKVTPGSISKVARRTKATSARRKAAVSETTLPQTVITVGATSTPRGKRVKPTPVDKSEELPLPTPPAEFIPIEAINQHPSEFIYPTLSFDYEEAKAHLINVDPRFKDLFAKYPCRPFEHGLDIPLDPFRTLCTSIISQQISWKAAKAITTRFVALYRPPTTDTSDLKLSNDIVEAFASAATGGSAEPNFDKSDPSMFFPTANQVAATPFEVLRSVGLSGQKAKYILDLSTRFRDGLLSTKMLVDAPIEEVMEGLIAVKGIGPWTAQMACMFCLRKPNVLPVGDLGIQKGMCMWFNIPGRHSKSAYLSKEKMEELAEPWKPYQSIGSYYMWQVLGEEDH